MTELFSPITLGSITVKNRIIRSATNEHLSDIEGNFTPELGQAYIDLAKGGCGLLITGHYSVLRDCRCDPGQPVVDDGLDIPALKESVDAVHAEGCTIIMQLSHPGPKAVVCRNGAGSVLPADFSREELDQLRAAFIHGAQLAQQAGMDGVQVHLAHGYCLSSFVDPDQNHRADEYGGESVEDRFRLPGEIIRGIRAACGPDFLITVKMNCDRSDQGKAYAQTMAQVLNLCAEAGVQLAEVSGLGFAAFPASKADPYYLEACKTAGLPENSPIPMALVGGLDSRAKLQQALDAGFACVSLSRSLIHDPAFVNKLQTGEADEAACLRCKGCFRSYNTKYTRCILHEEPIALLKEVFG